MVLSKLKRWFLLKIAKKEEKKHIPSKKEIEDEHQHFMNEAKDLVQEAKKEK